MDEIVKSRSESKFSWFHKLSRSKKAFLSVSILTVVFSAGLVYWKIRLSSTEKSKDWEREKQKLSSLSTNGPLSVEGIKVMGETAGILKNESGGEEHFIQVEGSIKSDQEFTPNHVEYLTGKVKDVVVKEAQTLSDD